MQLSKHDNDLVYLTQQAIRIPSWVGTDVSGVHHNENDLVDFLEQWILCNTSFQVSRQFLPGGRFNLIAGKGNPDLVFLAHTDTVRPSLDAPYDPFAAEIHNGKIWGLGATDMKSGLTAMLHAIALSPGVNNIWMFLYADEEYDFLGMKHIVKDYSDIRPQLIVSSDGSDLQIGFGCRGCIEFRMRVLGESGHAAKGTGNNAIIGALRAIEELRNELDQYTNPVMGNTSMNLAYLHGGTLIEGSVADSGYLSMVAQNGNKVPDVCEFVIDIRPASPDLDQRTVLSLLTSIINRIGLKVDMTVRTHDLGAWFTDPGMISQYHVMASEVLGHQVEFDNPAKSGYLDLQMLWQTVDKPTALMFGGGVGKTAHMPNEHIEISSLIKTRDFFQRILSET